MIHTEKTKEINVKIIPLFCTAHPLLRITLRHPRWRRFFRLARKEQTRATFAELKLLFAIIMPQIGWQLSGLLSKNKKMKEMCVIPKSAVVFTSQPSSCGIINMSWLRLWIMGAVKSVGQLYGSPTALTSQYLERRIFLEQIRPIVTPEPCKGDQSLM